MSREWRRKVFLALIRQLRRHAFSDRNSHFIIGLPWWVDWFISTLYNEIFILTSCSTCGPYFQTRFEIELCVRKCHHSHMNCVSENAIIHCFSGFELFLPKFHALWTRVAITITNDIAILNATSQDLVTGHEKRFSRTLFMFLALIKW
jgi:hypothetical protein